MGTMCGQSDKKVLNDYDVIRDFEEQRINPGSTNIKAKEGDRILTRGSREILDRQKNPIFQDSALRNRAVDAQNPNYQVPMSIGQKALRDSQFFSGMPEALRPSGIRRFNDAMNPSMELFNRNNEILRQGMEVKPPPGSGGVDPLARKYRGGIVDSPPPREQGFIDSYNHPLSKYVEPFSDFMGKLQGYDMDTEQGRYEFWLAGQEADKAYQEGQEERNRDRDRANMKTNIQGVGTPLDPCPEGYVFNSESQKCEPVESETTDDVYTKNPQSMGDFLGGMDITQYGRTGTTNPGEYQFFMADGGMRRAPQGEVKGQGGPKDDLVGPVMLSNTEYVLPNEQVKMYGGGNYNTGLKRLEKDRKNALKNYS